MERSAEIRRRIETIEKALSELKAIVLDDPQEEDPLFDWRRIAAYLGAFVNAPDGRLSANRAAEAAKQAGYDPRGTGGFYTGTNNALKSDGPWRVITDAGRRLYDTARAYIDE